MLISTYALLLTLVILLVIAGVTAFILARRHLERMGLVSRSLNLALLLVRFPPYSEAPEIKIQETKTKIALMEQLYVALGSVEDSWFRSIFYGRPVFAVELAVPHFGEELSFYVAVPRRFALAVEKIIHGIFPDAKLEESRDYNIFNPEGAAAGGRMVFKKNPYLPIRTYQKLEADPLSEIASAFTKLAKIGEGASLQIIARPAPSSWITILNKNAKAIREGKKLSEDVVIKMLRAVDEALGMTARPEKAKSSEAPTPVAPHDEERARMLEAKAAKTLFECNVRIMTSAATKARARDILQSIGVAFTQFADPLANSFTMVEVGEGAAMKNLTFNFSFRNFSNRDLVVLNTEELTSLFHFPNIPLSPHGVKKVKAREAPPPLTLPREGIILGYNEYRGERREIRIRSEDRRRHFYVIGQTGTGKSVLMENMAIQDIAEGRGVCVIDPHGDMVERLLSFIPRERQQDVIYFNPGDIERPMGLNMLEYDVRFPHHKSLIVDELIGIFNKLFNMSIAGGPIFEQYFRNAALLVMEDPSSGNTLFEIERVLSEKPFRDLKLSRSKNVVVKQFWTQIAEKAGGEASLKDMVPYIASKFDGFVSHDVMRPIILQEKSAFNFRDVMDEGKILLINLSKGHLGELNSSLLGLIIVGKILMAAFSRADVDEAKRKDFYLYIDEFQNVTTDSIATILSEARKYRLNLTITHQFIGQLKEEIKKAVFGNVGSIAAFRIGSDDGEFMATQFKPVATAYDLLNIDNFNCFMKLLVAGEPTTPFSMKTYPPSKGDTSVVATIKEISRTKYGRPREEVEEEIINKHSASLT